MTKTTTTLATIFFVLSIVLGNLTAGQIKKTDEWENLDDSTKVSVTRRVCGYLGSPDARPFNFGKQEEVKRRVKHL